MTPEEFKDKIPINLSFVNPVQEEFYYCNKRNQCFSGGYGNGKSFGASMKALTLLCTFPRYRFGISRYSSKELTQSTMETFYKICPPELYSEAYGGRRNDREGYLRLVNNSEVLWMHLDDYSEEDLRGKEFNSVFTDQGEEIAENIYITLDARIERWDRVEIPPYLNPERFPKNPFSKKPMPPCYNMVLVNPDTTVHWVYRRFHPESPEILQHSGPLEKMVKFGDYSAAYYFETAAYFTAATHDNPAIPETLKREMRKRDQAWVKRFYWGEWGIAGGAIHMVDPKSIIEYKDAGDLLELIKKDGVKFRVLDHGETSPTCCLWFAWLSPNILTKYYGKSVYRGIHVCYREYYMPNRLISYHRAQIHSLSAGERYAVNLADPSIFKVHSQNPSKDSFWTISDEYQNRNLNAPPLHFVPADNDEMATRNAVSEMLMFYDEIIHPVTGESPAPQMYFIKRSPDYPNGANMVLHETQSQRHKRIASINGSDVYSDDRDNKISDHAYDPLRYYSVWPKTNQLPDAPKVEHEFSFQRIIERRRRNRFIKHGSGVYGR